MEFRIKINLGATRFRLLVVVVVEVGVEVGRSSFGYASVSLEILARLSQCGDHKQ